jgi:hypothetical protein
MGLKHKHIYLLLAATALISSCQKVINVDLNSASPATVVQGNLPNTPNHDTVQLTQTVNFSEPNTFPAISGAFVTVSDNAGNLDTLFENPAGMYSTSKMIGTPGRTYTLNITANGKIYTATSTMAAPVAIDTLTITKSIFGKSSDQVNVIFTDPAGIVNYYRFVEKINNTIKERNYITDDQLQDGQKITFPLFGDNDSIKSGDSVRVWLQSIDKGVFTYYSSLDNASGGGGANVAPANPTSNVTNGALGYFSAYSVTTKSIIVP